MRYSRIRHCTGHAVPHQASELLICEDCASVASAAGATWADQVASFVEEHNARHGAMRLRIEVPPASTPAAGGRTRVSCERSLEVRRETPHHGPVTARGASRATAR